MIMAIAVFICSSLLAAPKVAVLSDELEDAMAEGGGMDLPGSQPLRLITYLGIG